MLLGDKSDHALKLKPCSKCQEEVNALKQLIAEAATRANLNANQKLAEIWTLLGMRPEYNPSNE